MKETEKNFYYFTLATSSSGEDQVYSRYFSRTFLIFFISIVSAGLIIAAFGLSYLIAIGNSKHTSTALRQQNKHLKESIASWQRRSEAMQTEIDALKKSNADIRIAADLPVPEIEYGVGGADTKQPMYNDIPELTMTEKQMARLETDIRRIRIDLSQLEQSVESRLQQIAHYPSIRPIRGGWLSSRFGRRLDPFTGKYEQHNGIDLSTKPGTEVFATAAGRIKRVNTRVVKNKGFGKYIVIDHGYGYETLYAHLNQVFVKPGQQVKRWDLIALTGNTGKSTAPHIHYATIKNGKDVNPLNFILE